MPRHCPDCSTLADDNLGYCPGCARTLTDQARSRYPGLWETLSMLVASMSIAGAAIFYFLRQ